MDAVPSDELVLIYWLKTLSGLPTSSISTSLPGDNTSWAASGFITVLGVGGDSNIYVPMNNPVLSVDTWANTPNSNKPPWSKASQLAELIVWRTYAHPHPGLITMPSGYEDVALHSVYPVSRPRRIPDDEAGFAHFSVDLAIHWSLAEGSAA
jgi:hypothetical protein